VPASVDQGVGSCYQVMVSGHGSKVAERLCHVTQPRPLDTRRCPGNTSARDSVADEASIGSPSIQVHFFCDYGKEHDIGSELVKGGR